MDVVIFGIHLKFSQIAFTLPIGKNGWDVYWYGIMIALGFLGALLYAMKNADRFNLSFDKLVDAIIVTVPVSILCARIYYVLFDGEKLTSIKDFFGFGTSSGFSGIAIYGSVIGAFGAGALMCYIKKINIKDAFDLTSIGFLIGQAFGRWGNFFNQEAYGTFTGSSWWGMESNRTASELGPGLVHPCFLYESLWCVAGFFLLNYFSKRRKYSGQITLMYLAWYGIERGFLELIRTDSLMLGDIRVSSLLAFLLTAASVTAMIIINKKLSQKNQVYENVFSDVSEENEIEEETENGENN